MCCPYIQYIHRYSSSLNKTVDFTPKGLYFKQDPFRELTQWWELAFTIGFCMYIVHRFNVFAISTLCFTIIVMLWYSSLSKSKLHGFQNPQDPGRIRPQLGQCGANRNPCFHLLSFQLFSKAHKQLDHPVLGCWARCFMPSQPSSACLFWCSLILWAALVPLKVAAIDSCYLTVKASLRQHKTTEARATGRNTDQHNLQAGWTQSKYTQNVSLTSALGPPADSWGLLCSTPRGASVGLLLHIGLKIHDSWSES